MSDPFLSSDEYDERAHQLYNEGQYDDAIDTLREGLGLYPHAVELHVGMGYARLAREEYAWARRAFEEARGLDPNHEDALAGLGEVLLKFGERAAALACFERILALGFDGDHDLMLQIGRALFREGVLDQARRFFEGALGAHPDSADAAACVGYAAHRLADEGGSLHWLRRALELDPSLGEARVYLANLLYDRGEYEAALFHLERTGPEEHYDALAIWRLIELKKSVYRLPDDDPELVPWQDRLNELAGDAAPEDLLLAEIEAMGPDGQIRDPRQLELFGTLLTELQGMKNRGGSASTGAGEVHRVSTVSGATYVGTWEEIVRQMKDDAAEWAGGSLEQYMEASAKRWRKQTGLAIPATDPETFLRAGADAGVLRILH
ncbi:MAG TPA: tetratricopeptide repeat protein [Gemmatimonadales bacterium]|nr:tetratricopeptide repeat protein [Gemmatimonadales bacterium]